MARKKKSSPKVKKPAKVVPLPGLTLSIDAAGAAGVAVFLGRKLVAYSPANGTSWVTLMQIVKPLVEPYQHIPVSTRLMVIEAHWMNKMSSKGSMTLGQRRGIAQSVGEALGFPFSQIEYIPSSTWQSVIFDHTRVVDTKAASIAFVTEAYGFVPSDDNIADAISLGHYALHRGHYIPA